MTIRGVFRAADELRDVAAGEVVFAEGDPGREMYGVVSGSVELTRGGEHVATIGAEGTFGELALIDHEPRSLTATATEATQLAVVNERTFLVLVKETPTFALEVMRSLATRLREVGTS